MGSFLSRCSSQRCSATARSKARHFDFTPSISTGAKRSLDRARVTMRSGSRVFTDVRVRAGYEYRFLKDRGEKNSSTPGFCPANEFEKLTTRKWAEGRGRGEKRVENDENDVFFASQTSAISSNFAESDFLFPEFFVFLTSTSSFAGAMGRGMRSTNVLRERNSAN